MRVRVTAREGHPLVAEWSLPNTPENAVAVQSREPLGAASRREISAEFVRTQFGRLGDTAYQLSDLSLDVEGHPFAPASLLNQIRRDAVAQLEALQSRLPSIEIRDAAAVLESALASAPRHAAGPAEPCLHLLVRTPDQLDAALELEPASITLDYLDLYGLKPSVDRVRQARIGVRVASPRILKPGEDRVVQFLLKLECPILVRSAGLLATLEGKQHPSITADFSLNAANVLTAGTFLGFGLERITPTYDLNAAQVADLARAVGAGAIEVVAYQHLPVFHTEHCVFCRFLSTGTTYKDCGRPCERHRVAVRDLTGRSHPVMADVGCRNTVFGAEAQEGSLHLDVWRQAGIRHFRLEFVHETPDQVARIGTLFEETLAGRRSPHQLSRELIRIAPQSTTEGSYFVPQGYLSLPVLG